MENIKLLRVYTCMQCEGTGYNRCGSRTVDNQCGVCAGLGYKSAGTITLTELKELLGLTEPVKKE